jgi:hypothetical protein
LGNLGYLNKVVTFFESSALFRKKHIVRSFNKIKVMGNKKGSKKLKLRNGDEHWEEFCTKAEALEYVARGWCSAESVAEKWPEDVNENSGDNFNGDNNNDYANDERHGEVDGNNISLVDMQNQVLMIESSQEQVLNRLETVSETMNTFKESIAELIMNVMNHVRNIQSNTKTSENESVLNFPVQQL